MNRSKWEFPCVLRYCVWCVVAVVLATTLRQAALAEVASRTAFSQADEAYNSGDRSASIRCLRRAIKLANQENNPIYQAKYTEILAILIDTDAMSDPKEAEALFKSAVQLREASLWADHPDVIQSRYNLARHYERHGMLVRSQDLLNKNAATARASGKHAVNDIETLSHLGELNERLGNKIDSEALYKEASNIAISSANATAKKETLNLPQARLVGLYCNQERWNKAEPVCARYVDDLRKQYGDNDSGLASQLFILASIRCRLGKYNEAEPAIEEAIRICQKNNAANKTLVPMLILAGSVHQCTADLPLAESECKKALMEATRSQKVQIFLTLTRIYHAQGKRATANDSLKRAVSLLSALSEKESSDAVAILVDIGIRMNAAGNQEGAITALRSARSLARNRDDQKAWINASEQLAGTLATQKHFDESSKLWLELLPLKSRMNRQDKTLAMNYASLGDVYCCLEKFAEAKKSYNTAMSMLTAKTDAANRGIISERLSVLHAAMQKQQPGRASEETK